MESILIEIKKLLGIEDGDTQFDTDVIIHINTALFKLRQIGIGPVGGLRITDKTGLWSDLIGDREDLDAVKDYVYLKVRLVFDPPQSGVLIDSIKEQIAEIEWHLNNQ